MEFTSKTEKIPKGYGFLLKPSVILKELNTVQTAARVHLVRSHGRRIFEAKYKPPEGDVPWERFHIKVGTAHERDLPELRRQAKFEALPALVQWMSDIVATELPSLIRRGDQDIVFMPPRE